MVIIIMYTLLCRGKTLLCDVLTVINLIKVKTLSVPHSACFVSFSPSSAHCSSSSTFFFFLNLLSACLGRSECGVWGRKVDMMEICVRMRCAEVTGRAGVSRPHPPRHEGSWVRVQSESDPRIAEDSDPFSRLRTSNPCENHRSGTARWSTRT